MRDAINTFLSASGKKEWKAHWIVVAAVMVGMATSQVHLFSFGLIIDPLQDEFGWTRAQISSGLLMISIISVPLSPVVGMMIDRYGPRRIALFGKALYCTALACLALTAQPLWTWWLLWLLLAVGVLFHSPTVWVATIASLFSASRGLALAAALTAAGVASMAIPLISYFWIEDFGWRVMFVLWGVLIGISTIPFMYFFLYSAMDRNRNAAKVAGAPVIKPHQHGISIGESLKRRAIYQMSSIGFVISFTTVALALNMVPILNSLGMDRATAAAIAGLFGLSQIFGRLACGYFLDRFDARHVGAIVVVVPIVTCLMLLGFGGSPPIAAVAVSIIGFAVGAEVDVVGYLGSRLFGGRNFGTLYGIVTSLTALGVGLGPVAASLVYDITGSYNLVLWATIPLSIMSALLLLTLERPPPIAADDAQANTMASTVTP